MSVPGLLLERARATPDAVALRSKRRGIWQTTTWSGLLDRVCRVAAGLEELGVRTGGAVGLVGENTPDWIVCDLAAQALGARSVALPPQTLAPAVVRALAEAGVGVVVCGDQEQVDLVVDAGDDLAGVRAIVVVNPTGTEYYEDPRLRSLAAVEAVAPLDADGLIGRRAGGEIAATVFSAGMSGDPRPAELTADALVETARAAAGRLELGASDRSVCVLSLATPAARVLDLYAAIAAGAEIAVPESPATTAGDLIDAAPTVLCVSPRALGLLRLTSERRARESARLRRRVYDWGMHRLERRGGGVAHLVVGRWVAAKLGLARTRRMVVTGGPVASRELRFFRGLGVPVVDDGSVLGGEWHASAEPAQEAPVEAALCESAYIRRAVVADGAALVEMDPDATALWAADRRVAFSTYGSLVALPEVRELAAAEVAAANARLEPGAGVAGFTVLPRELSVARGELTALLTVRREPVLEHFAAELGESARATHSA